MRIVLALGLALALDACGGAGGSLTPAGQTMLANAHAGTSAAATASEFVGFWESWSDTNGEDAFSRLEKVPASVTTTDVAFSIADSNAISAPQNTYPLDAGAQHIHSQGGKLLLSFGGSTSPFSISNPQRFVRNLHRYLKIHPNLYDGFDFDDEVIPTNGQQQLIGVLLAVRRAFPNATVSFDAFIDGADPGPRTYHQGEDIAIIAAAGRAIDYVNVMAYDQDGWVPTTHPNCNYREGSRDDCRIDALREFGDVTMENGKKFPLGKIVLGLMIGQDDFGVTVTPNDASGYARFVRRAGYRGIMIWDLDRDNGQVPPAGTGHPDGTYVRDISRALGT